MFQCVWRGLAFCFLRDGKEKSTKPYILEGSFQNKIPITMVFQKISIMFIVSYPYQKQYSPFINLTFLHLQRNRPFQMIKFKILIKVSSSHFNFAYGENSFDKSGG